MFKNRFIENCSKTHSIKYNYDRVPDSFTTDNKPYFEIGCPNCLSFFKVRYDQFQKGSGCPKCKQTGRKKSTSLDEIKALHPELDFTNSEYGKNIKFVCKKHGEQTLSLQALKRKTSGCPACKTNKMQKEEFLDKAIKKFSNTYNYSLIKEEDISIDQNIDIKCNVCNSTFTTTRRKFLNANIPCKTCRKQIGNINKRISFEEFVERANKIHKNFYTYQKDKYIMIRDYTYIICPIHGEFKQEAYKHVLGSKCQQCAIEQASELKRNSEDQTITNINNRLKSSKFLRFKDGYKNYDSYAVCKCNLCGAEFEKAVGDIVSNGQECKYCSDKHLTEFKVFNKLIKNGIKCEREKKDETLRYKSKLRIDIFLEEKNIAIEIQGPHHFRPFKYANISDKQAELNFKEQQIKDEIKRNWCKSNNILLLEIPVEELNTDSKIDNWFEKNKSTLK